MDNENIYGIKYEVDIESLKTNTKEAGKQIKMANAEFNESASKLDKWENSVEGVSAKIKQMNTILDAEKSKLASSQQEYNKQIDSISNYTKRIEELKNKKQQAIEQYGKESTEVKSLTIEIGKLEREQQAGINTVDRLKVSIMNQQASVNRTEKAVKDYGTQLNELKEAQSRAEKSGNTLEEELKKIRSTADQTGESVEKMEGGFTVLKGSIASLLADGIRGLIAGFKDLATESEKANATFQSSTGVSTESMKAYNQQMKELYKENYGESLDDIARAMAEVKQQTGELNPTKLKELTKNAIALRDTFDFDIKESTRAVKMLMEQFGITGEEAFNLISQGAQNGLDKNGDLLDTINEYSPYWKQMGLDAEQSFNTLYNGADAGTFSIDKIGDAYKEFNIRVKDTAQTTTEGFELLGLNADMMRNEFAKGGDSAKKATDIVIKAFDEMEDPVKKNQAGVDLWGTMYEDLGEKGIKSLMNVNGQATKTAKTMEQINKVKYNDIGNQFKELGRTVKTDLLAPALEKILPIVKDTVSWIKSNLPTIIPVVKTVGTVIATAFAINSFVSFNGAVTNTIGNLVTMTTKIPALQKGLSGLQAFLVANPWVALATAILGVGTAILMFVDNETEASKEIEENSKVAQENREAWDEMVEARKKSVEDIAGEYGYYERLKEELQSLTDENGKVKEGYEGRAKFIANELNSALGSEIEMVDGVIVKYQEQMITLDQLVEKQRAKAIIDAGASSYSEAIANQTKALGELSTAEKNYTDKKKEYKDYYDKFYEGAVKTNDLYTLGEIERLEKETKATEQTYKDKRTVVEGYTDTIAQQQYLQKLYASGNAEDIAIINDYVSKSYDDKGKKIILTTQQQVENEETLLDYMKQRYKDTGDQMYKDQITASENRLTQLRTDLTNQTSTINEEAPKTSSAWELLCQSGISAYSKNSDEYRLIAMDQTLKAKNGINAGTPETKKAWQELERQGLAEYTKNGWEYTVAGENYVNGIKEGIKNERGNVWTLISGVGGGMIQSLKDSLGIKSPSKKTKWQGEMFLNGFALAIKNGAKSLREKVSTLGKELLGDMQGELDKGMVVNADVISSIKGNAGSTLNNLKKELSGSNNTSKNTLGEKVQNIIFNQSIQSPKAVNRLEVYKNTKSIVFSAKGRLKNV